MNHSRFTRFFAWLTLGSFVNATVFGATVDVANVPLVSMSTKTVRPNVMFILDDSGSMLRDYMPDDVNDNSSRPCFRNHGYNKVFYDPAATYDLPLQANGSPVTYSPTLSSARTNGFDSGSGTVDLSTTTTITTYNWGGNVSLTSTSFTATNGSASVVVTRLGHGMNVGDVVRFTGTPTSGSARGINWSNITWTAGNNRRHTVTAITLTTFTFTTWGSDTANASGTFGQTGSNFSKLDSTTTTTTNDVFYYTHPTNPSTCDTDGNYTRVDVNSLSSAQQTNYARWYSFYRTRLLMMKSSVGRAFNGVDDNFRVGFTTINEQGTSNATRFLGVQRFNTTNKGTWYSTLYNLPNPGAGQLTPLRGALSKAGRYFSGTLVTGNSDPVQYSCQKNFAILSTDGYWNTGNESTTYGPRDRDNSADVGDQDGDTATSPRPMYDAGNVANTLADVARYYYRTDLRPDNTAHGGLGDDSPATTRPVGVNATDSNGVALPDGHQHMKTITLGLGLTGDLTYPTDLPALTSGSLNWPDPVPTDSGNNGNAARLDDLWHAAVNGGGVFLSASNSEAVVDSLRAALATISDQNLSGASAATSSLEPVAGDNYAYVAEYTTSRWFGDLEARTIDLSSGAISTSRQWSAQELLNGTVSASTDTRNIYTWNAAGTARADFTLANVNAASFNPALLSQYAGWNATQRANATAGSLLNYLRGRHEFETRNDATHTDLNSRLYRQREHVLGDIIDSSPVYVKKPPFRYTDAGYAGYVGAQTGRSGTVYVGANDGMLHAFDAENGAERWAYVPRMLHSELYRLADSNYPSNHRNYVNGNIVVGDAYNGSSWRTVLIAGLGSGGNGYFALDVTDPEDPIVLWEYTNANLYSTFGNPVLTKRSSDGTWVVLFASGYNRTNTSSEGRLFMLDAFTGAELGSVATTTTNNSNLSGIAKITNWVLDTLVDNSTQYVYGGDLAGNLWRFDINAMTVSRMGQTASVAGARPITARPEVARIRDVSGNYHRVVYVGTGRYLGGADVAGGSLPESTQQVMLAVKDTNSDLGVLTDAGASLVQQTLNTGVSPRTIPSPQPVDWSSGEDNGWYVALPLGERVTIEPRLQLGTVSFVANNPVDDYCALGGSSWLYALDYKSGGAISTQAGNLVGYQVDDSTIGTGLTIIRLPDGTLIGIVNTPQGTQTQELPTTAAGAGSVRRVGYREIN